MNYLAHAYLSFGEPEILVGNMISDFVKGKTKFTYSPGIQKGIALHRAIDQFTDDHPATKAAKIFFKPAYRLYSGAFVDVVYDHFLAIDNQQFPAGNLAFFCTNIYEKLNDYFFSFPPSFRQVFLHMKKSNWLYNYQFRWGMEKAFGGLVARAAYMDDASMALKTFTENYIELRSHYDEFFPQLKEFASATLSNLLSDDSLYL